MTQAAPHVPSPDVVARLERLAPELAAQALRRMESDHPWYHGLSARNRAGIGVVAQSGVNAFVSWYRDPRAAGPVTVDVFGPAPRELMRALSLSQTLDLVRVGIGVVEDAVPTVSAPAERAGLHRAVLVYSREIAFSAAHLYAQAAEARGAWDARLESLVVSAVVRGEADDSLQSRASSLGWGAAKDVCVVVGPAPAVRESVLVGRVRRAAGAAGLDALAAVVAGRLVVLLAGLGDEGDPLEAARALEGVFAPGAVVAGPVVPRLFGAGRSARAALSGYDSARAWPGSPRPTTAEELLPERVLLGEAPARRALAARVWAPLREYGRGLPETARAYLESGGSLEATARALFVHANTVRYRLGRIADLTGYDLADPRDAWAARIALAVADLDESPSRPWRDTLRGSRAAPGESRSSD